MPEYGLVGARLPSRREVFVREGAEEGGRAARENSPFSTEKRSTTIILLQYCTALCVCGSVEPAAKNRKKHLP